jgi:hypothetical protein
MAKSEIVDAKYRVHADDLNGQRHEWVIANVTYEGLEELSPVLHIEGLTKRFVLDQEQSHQMMSLTHSFIPDDWVGARIWVAPTVTAEDEKILITSADMPERSRWPRLGSASIGPAPLSVWLTLLIIVITLALIFAWTSPKF